MADVDFQALASDVKKGKPGAMLELWESVRRFVHMKARERIEKYYQYQVYVTFVTGDSFVQNFGLTSV